MPLRAKNGALKQRLFHAIPVIVLAIVATYALNWMGILSSFERHVWDVAFRGEPECPGATSSDPCPPIALVIVTDADYDNIFGGRSPLNVATLNDLIVAIAAQEPSVIAVDIDTSPIQFRALNPRFKRPDGKLIPIIWEREVTSNNETDTIKFSPQDILGSRDPGLNKNSGIPALFDDPLDKVTRYYRRCINTAAGDVPSFVYAVAKEHFPALYHEHSGINKRLCIDDLRSIEFTLRPGTIDMIPSETVLDAKKNRNTLAVLKNRIVILGGTYRDYDIHFTPFGQQRGIMVLANALQSELFDLSGVVPSHMLLFVAEAVAATFIVFLVRLYSLSAPSMLVVGLVLTAGLSYIFSLILYHSPSGLRFFIPTLLSVLLFELFEDIRVESIEWFAHRKETRPNGDHET